MRKKIELMILLTATVGFFGFVYPELCLLDSTIIVVEEGDEDNKQQTEDVQNAEDVQQSEDNTQHSEGADLLEQISGLPPEKVRIKSRLFECFSEIGRKD